MFIIFPIGQESELRRWPWITIGLVAVMVLIHLYIELTMLHIKSEYNRVVAEYNQMYKDFQIMYFRQHRRDARRIMSDLTRRDFDVDDIMAYTKDIEKKTLKAIEDGELISKDSDDYQRWTKLKSRKEQLEKRMILPDFSFHTRNPKPITWVTSLFLHAGLFHLLFNMVFLWFTGLNLEDRWGKLVYLFLFLGGGIAGNAAFLYFNSTADAQLVGASGAIAALMGAFLIRFPTVPIRLFFLWFGFSFVHRVFTVKAYIPILTWFTVQVAMVGIGMGNVAYEAHVGGFLFGAFIAILLWITGLDRRLDQTQERIVESKTTVETFRVHPSVEKALSLADSGKLRLAVSILEEALKTDSNNPDLLETEGKLLIKGGQVRRGTHRTMQAVISLAEHHRCEDALLLFQQIKDAGNLPVVSGKRLIKLATKLHRDGFTEDALAILDEVISRGDSDASSTAAKELRKKWNETHRIPPKPTTSSET